MNTPEWLKPALYGAAAGAAAIAIVGFSWGGWVTGGTAERMAADTANAQVVAALVPICLEQSRLDPDATVKLAQLQEASTVKRADMLIEAGWATMPGAAESDRKVAAACVKELAARF
jgi:alpha/beta superfamily hydrolase